MKYSPVCSIAHIETLALSNIKLLLPIVGLILSLTSSRQVTSREYRVIVCGGPGTFDARDRKHDVSWGNYVTAPLQDNDLLRNGVDTHWLVYRPAYVKRWEDDVNATKDVPRQNEIKRVLSISPEVHSYADLLEFRARQRKWKLIWIYSADDFWKFMSNAKPTISLFRYYGHAQYDLWLDLNHNDKGEPVAPNPQAIISVADMDLKFVPHFTEHHLFHQRNENYIFGYQNIGKSEFFGCNTFVFAKAWAPVFGTYAMGLQGKLDFVEMLDPRLPRKRGFSDWQVEKYDGSPKEKPAPYFASPPPVPVDLHMIAR